MGAEPPAELTALADRRQAARAARDYQLADSLRDQIEAAGWRVVDGAGGWRLEALGGIFESHPTVAALPATTAEPDRFGHSLCLAVHGWPDDVRRLLEALAREGDATDGIEVVAVDAAGAGLTREDIAPSATWAGELRVIRIDAPLGQADAWNAAARAAHGRLLHFVEPSLEFGTGVLAALESALADDGVGLVGAFGLSTNDMRSFSAYEGGEVDALEYLLTIRRADLGAVGQFDARYRFYRNLDIDFSYQVRAAGLRVRRVDCGPIIRHRHRLWEATPEAERERLSRKNFNRFLDRWGRS